MHNQHGTTTGSHSHINAVVPAHLDAHNQGGSHSHIIRQSGHQHGSQRVGSHSHVTARPQGSHTHQVSHGAHQATHSHHQSQNDIVSVLARIFVLLNWL